MINPEIIQFIETYSQEVTTALNSIQDLVLLAQRYQNPAETQYHLGLISTCVMKVQENMQKSTTAETGITAMQRPQSTVHSPQ